MALSDDDDSKLPNDFIEKPKDEWVSLSDIDFPLSLDMVIQKLSTITKSIKFSY